jgi:hypothetical protein
VAVVSEQEIRERGIGAMAKTFPRGPVYVGEADHALYVVLTIGRSSHHITLMDLGPHDEVYR